MMRDDKEMLIGLFVIFFVSIALLLTIPVATSIAAALGTSWKAAHLLTLGGLFMLILIIGLLLCVLGD